jgi:hypothetical protein
MQAGHQRAVVSLGFCSPLRMLVSGGYDHEVSPPFPLLNTDANEIRVG